MLFRIKGHIALGRVLGPVYNTLVIDSRKYFKFLSSSSISRHYMYLLRYKPLSFLRFLPQGTAKSLQQFSNVGIPNLFDLTVWLGKIVAHLPMILKMNYFQLDGSNVLDNYQGTHHLWNRKCKCWMKMILMIKGTIDIKHWHHYWKNIF